MPQAWLQQARSIDWFDSDIIRKDLGRKSFQGFAFSFSVQALKFCLNVGATAILARLLSPDDFGVVALVVAVTGIAYIFTDLGLSAAVIQRSRFTDEEANCLFWITVAMGLVIASAVAFTGPILSTYLRDSRLAAVAPVIALSFIFTAIGSQHQALLRRHMRFRTIGAIELISATGGYLIAIILASYGYKYWALVYAQVSTFAFIAVMSWVACPWRPGPMRWVPSAKPMIRFGWHVTGSNLLSYLSRNLDNVLVGRFCGAMSLGLYSKAYQLLLLPIWQINIPMLGVMTAALSRLQSDPQRFKQLYLKAIMAIVSVGMPLVVFMFVRAEQIILVALGKNWMGAVLLFRLLAPAAFMDTFNIAAGLIFNTLGQTERQLRLSIVSAFVIILGICVGIRWGVQGVAIGLSVATCIIRIPAYRYVYAESPVRVGDLLAILWRPATCSIVAGAALSFVPNNLRDSTLAVALALPKDLVIFAACFLSVWVLLPNGATIMRDTVNLLKSVLDPGKQHTTTNANGFGP